jgi:hypothetical protein
MKRTDLYVYGIEFGHIYAIKTVQTMRKNLVSTDERTPSQAL